MSASTNCVCVLIFAGVVRLFAGSTYGMADGLSTTAQFGLVYGLIVNSNSEVLVADNTNCRIRKISSSGEDLINFYFLP